MTPSQIAAEYERLKAERGGRFVDPVEIMQDIAEETGSNWRSIGEVLVDVWIEQGEW